MSKSILCDLPFGMYEIAQHSVGFGQAIARLSLSQKYGDQVVSQGCAGRAIRIFYAVIRRLFLPICAAAY